MDKIIMAKKMENGIALYYGVVAERKFVSFNFSELIDQHINALDILEHPDQYLLDTVNHQVIMNK